MMEAPNWARWKGVHAELRYEGWFSDTQYSFHREGENNGEVGRSYYPLKDWEEVGWVFEEINICLENK